MRDTKRLEVFFWWAHSVTYFQQQTLEATRLLPLPLVNCFLISNCQNIMRTKILCIQWLLHGLKMFDIWTSVPYTESSNYSIEDVNCSRNFAIRSACINPVDCVLHILVLCRENHELFCSRRNCVPQLKFTKLYCLTPDRSTPKLTVSEKWVWCLLNDACNACVSQQSIKQMYPLNLLPRNSWCWQILKKSSILYSDLDRRLIVFPCKQLRLEKTA